MITYDHLFPSLDLPTLLLLGFAALLAGFIDAIAGGGGMLVMPALLSAGMPPHLVVGTKTLKVAYINQ